VLGDPSLTYMIRVPRVQVKRVVAKNANFAKLGTVENARVDSQR